MPRPTLFLLHGLGLSAASWDGVVAALGDRFEIVALDLPGEGTSLQETAERVAEQVRGREPDEWLLAGDGTGGAVAAIVTGWAERGAHGLIAPAGLALLGVDGRSDAVGGLRTPVVVVGADDAGPAAHEVLLTQPGEVARSLLEFADRVVGHPVLPPAFARLIASDRVSARTRRVMLARLDEPVAAPRALSPAQHALLTALLARVLPQRGTDIDLASRIDAELAGGAGDGWRFAELPPDAEAWRRGLDTLAAAVPDYAALEPAAQDAALDRIEAGGIGADGATMLTAPRMVLWFQDVQATAVRTWLSHPAAQAWIRYDGFADGGDGVRKQGFTTTHAGEWEAWQRDWRTGKELRA